MIRVVFACLLLAAADSPEELEGSVSVSGNRVIVRALRDADVPAPGAKVRLAKAGSVLQEGRTDDNGYWFATINESGAYEIWLGDGPADDLLRMPFSMTVAVIEQANDESKLWPCCRGPYPLINWLPAAAGTVLLLVAGVMYFVFKASA